MEPQDSSQTPERLKAWLYVTREEWLRPDRDAQVEGKLDIIRRSLAVLARDTWGL